MAKKKRLGRPPKADERRRIASFTVRCSVEYRVWVDSLAAHCRKELTETVAEALGRLAKAKRFGEPPMR